MGLEPTTATLATWRSTTELHPHSSHSNYKCDATDFKGAFSARTPRSCRPENCSHESPRTVPCFKRGERFDRTEANKCCTTHLPATAGESTQQADQSQHSPNLGGTPFPISPNRFILTHIEHTPIIGLSSEIPGGTDCFGSVLDTTTGRLIAFLNFVRGRESHVAFLDDPSPPAVLPVAVADWPPRTARAPSWLMRQAAKPSSRSPSTLPS